MPKTKTTAGKPVTRKPENKQTSFQTVYARLNPAQKQAVETIEGPVMVIAGPGTGKTETLAVRVANILVKTQMRPSNILCLTYSTSGAKAMRERLREIIGRDAYGVTIETVHSFCNQIILDNPHVFEDWGALEQVSDVERLRIVRRAMRELPAGSILGKPALVEKRSNDILKRISDMKREGKSPDDLRKIVPIFLEEIKTTPTGKTRSETSQAYKDDLRLVQQLQEFAEIYEAYERGLAKMYRYDYEDMVMKTAAVLEKHDWLLASLQVRYNYILVDESQDLNGAQHSVISLLLREPIEKQRPNIFIVGDDDQAIYRFQGASVREMRAFLERYPEAPMIVLTENYRSTQPILDAASAVIAANEMRLAKKITGITKELKAQKHTSDIQSPLFLRYPSVNIELAGIAGIVKEEHDRGTPWNEIAILCRTNEELWPLAETLRAANIPVLLTAKQNLLLESPVREAMALLRAAEHPNNDAILSDALACVCFECHPTALGRLWCAYRDEARIRKESPGLRSYILARYETLPENIRRAMDVIEKLTWMKGVETLPHILEVLLKESGLLPPLDAQDSDPRSLAALHAFYSTIKTWAYEKKTIGLSDLLSTLDEYEREHGLSLEYDAPRLVENGVQLMTAHKAKGLEFDCVLLAHARFRNWGDKNHGSLLSLPDHLITGFDRGEEKHLKQEDERRLFYVAMTRARRRLILTFSETYLSGDAMKDAQPTSFLAEAGTLVHEQTAADMPEPIPILLQPKLEIDEAFAAFLREQMKDFRLSVTALNVFLRDPREFLWTQLLKQPQHKNASLSFGSIVHLTLERMHHAIMKGEVFTLDDLLAAFENFMGERELMTNHEREHYMLVGRAILTRYGNEMMNDHPIIANAERSFVAELDDIPLFGKVDRIDLLAPESRFCRVVDFKTGTPKKTLEAVRKEGNGNLFRQLVFYKLLCGRTRNFPFEATIFRLDFLGDEKERRRVLECQITQQEVQELEALIRAVWVKITALDFTPMQ